MANAVGRVPSAAALRQREYVAELPLSARMEGVRLTDTAAAATARPTAASSSAAPLPQHVSSPASTSNSRTETVMLELLSTMRQLLHHQRPPVVGDTGFASAATQFMPSAAQTAPNYAGRASPDIHNGEVDTAHPRTPSPSVLLRHRPSSSATVPPSTLPGPPFYHPAPSPLPAAPSLHRTAPTPLPPPPSSAPLLQQQPQQQSSAAPLLHLSLIHI